MKLVIIGAGYTGLRIARQAIERGWTVTATTNDPERTGELESLGASVLAWRQADRVDPLENILTPGCVVVYSIPTGAEVKSDIGLPPHVAAVEGVMRAARECGAERFIYLSSTSVYGDHGETWIDENTSRNPTSDVGRKRKEIEDHVLASPGNVNVVRIVGIYGPGRTMDRYLEGGRYKLVDGGEKLTNRIHVDDLAQVVLAVAEHGPLGSNAFIASDGNPSRVRDLVQWLVDNRGIAWPEEVSLETYRASRGGDAAARWENTYLAANQRVVDELGVELLWPNVFVGYAAIFAEEE